MCKLPIRGEGASPEKEILMKRPMRAGVMAGSAVRPESAKATAKRPRRAGAMAGSAVLPRSAQAEARRPRKGRGK